MKDTDRSNAPGEGTSFYAPRALPYGKQPPHSVFFEESPRATTDSLDSLRIMFASPCKKIADHIATVGRALASRQAERQTFNVTAGLGQQPLHINGRSMANPTLPLPTRTVTPLIPCKTLTDGNYDVMFRIM